MISGSGSRLLQSTTSKSAPTLLLVNNHRHGGIISLTSSSSPLFHCGINSKDKNDDKNGDKNGLFGNGNIYITRSYISKSSILSYNNQNHHQLQSNNQRLNDIIIENRTNNNNNSSNRIRRQYDDNDDNGGDDNDEFHNDGNDDDEEIESNKRYVKSYHHGYPEMTNYNLIHKVFDLLNQYKKGKDKSKTNFYNTESRIKFIIIKEFKSSNAASSTNNVIELFKMLIESEFKSARLIEVLMSMLSDTLSLKRLEELYDHLTRYHSDLITTRINNIMLGVYLDKDRDMYKTMLGKYNKDAPMNEETYAILLSELVTDMTPSNNHTTTDYIESVKMKEQHREFDNRLEEEIIKPMRLNRIPASYQFQSQLACYYIKKGQVDMGIRLYKEENRIDKVLEHRKRLDRFALVLLSMYQIDRMDLFEEVWRDMVGTKLLLPVKSVSKLFRGMNQKWTIVYEMVTKDYPLLLYNIFFFKVIVKQSFMYHQNHMIKELVEHLESINMLTIDMLQDILQTAYSYTTHSQDIPQFVWDSAKRLTSKTDTPLPQSFYFFLFQLLAHDNCLEHYLKQLLKELKSDGYTITHDFMACIVNYQLTNSKGIEDVETQVQGWMETLVSKHGSLSTLPGALLYFDQFQQDSNQLKHLQSHIPMISNRGVSKIIENYLIIGQYDRAVEYLMMFDRMCPSSITDRVFYLFILYHDIRQHHDHINEWKLVMKSKYQFTYTESHYQQMYNQCSHRMKSNITVQDETIFKDPQLKFISWTLTNNQIQKLLVKLNYTPNYYYFIFELVDRELFSTNISKYKLLNILLDNGYTSINLYNYLVKQLGDYLRNTPEILVEVYNRFTSKIPDLLNIETYNIFLSNCTNNNQFNLILDDLQSNYLQQEHINNNKKLKNNNNPLKYNSDTYYIILKNIMNQQQKQQQEQQIYHDTLNKVLNQLKKTKVEKDHKLIGLLIEIYQQTGEMDEIQRIIKEVRDKSTHASPNILQHALVAFANQKQYFDLFWHDLVSKRIQLKESVAIEIFKRIENTWGWFYQLILDHFPSLATSPAIVSQIVENIKLHSIHNYNNQHNNINNNNQQIHNTKELFDNILLLMDWLLSKDILTYKMCLGIIQSTTSIFKLLNQQHEKEEGQAVANSNFRLEIFKRIERLSMTTRTDVPSQIFIEFLVSSIRDLDIEQSDMWIDGHTSLYPKTPIHQSLYLQYLNAMILKHFKVLNTMNDSQQQPITIDYQQKILNLLNRHSKSMSVLKNSMDYSNMMFISSSIAYFQLLESHSPPLSNHNSQVLSQNLSLLESFRSNPDQEEYYNIIVFNLIQRYKIVNNQSLVDEWKKKLPGYKPDHIFMTTLTFGYNQ